MERHMRLEFAQGAELLCSQLYSAGLLPSEQDWANGSWEALVLEPNMGSPLKGAFVLCLFCVFYAVALTRVWHAARSNYA